MVDLGVMNPVSLAGRSHLQDRTALAKALSNLATRLLDDCTIRQKQLAQVDHLTKKCKLKGRPHRKKWFGL